ncbi:hypothetical protein XaC1_14 [Xanthomonas phage XaC1]|nr:hypothetical protein XaC1_14 [Xanthomonas phage XaC1]
MILTQHKVAVALHSISTVMLKYSICAMAAACDGYTDKRIEIMMQNGISAEDAIILERLEPGELVEFDLGSDAITYN